MDNIPSPEEAMSILNQRVSEGKKAKKAYEDYFKSYLDARRKQIVSSLFTAKLDDNELRLLEIEAKELTKFNSHMLSLVNSGIISQKELDIMAGNEHE